MKPPLTPAAYADSSIYTQEQGALRSKLWQFAGFTFDVAGDGDFLVCDVGGRSVIIRNCGGHLRAFHNVCAHRQSRICREPGGHGPLRCPYHGWTYDSEGVAVGIPFKQHFYSDGEAPDGRYRLRSWSVETCGTLIFVSEGLRSGSLREYLGGLHDRLRRYSEGLGPRLDTNELIVESNWKVAVENTLENYHVHMVHPDTFARLGTGGTNFEFTGLHSAWAATLNEASTAGWRRVEPVFADRPVRIDGYEHVLVFPNFTVATTFGMSFSFQQFQPLGPEKTRFTSHVFFSRVEEMSGARQAMVDLLAGSVVEFNRAVFLQDKEICETAQLGVREALVAGCLGAEEQRVHRFQEACVGILGCGG